MAVIYDNASAGYSGSTTATPSITHTTGSGSNRFLLAVLFSHAGNATHNSGTYDSAALTMIGTQFTDGSTDLSVWYRKMPNTGTNLTIAFSVSTDVLCHIGLMTFSGVDQTTPYNTPASISGSINDGTSVAPASALNDVVAYVFGLQGNVETTTPQGAEVERAVSRVEPVNGICKVGTIVGATPTTTVGYNWSTNFNSVALWAAALKAAAEGASDTLMGASMGM